jgi:hypothetical protein
MMMRWKVGRMNLRCRRDRWWARPPRLREKFLLLAVGDWVWRRVVFLRILGGLSVMDNASEL